MPLRSYPYTLELAHPFTLATSSRTTTPALMVEWEHEGLTGYGEAAMPPYLGETPASAAAFLKLVDPAAFPDLQQIATIGAHIDALAPGNPAAKAALDLALHDWVGKKLNTSWHRHWGLDLTRIPATSFTIGIDTPAVVRQKTLAAAPYKILKVKLGRDTDRELITTIRQVTDKPLTVDANQGWCDREDALRMSEWLATQGVLFIEQPMPKEQIDDTAWLRHVPLLEEDTRAARQRAGCQAHPIQTGPHLRDAFQALGHLADHRRHLVHHGENFVHAALVEHRDLHTRTDQGRGNIGL